MRRLVPVWLGCLVLLFVMGSVTPLHAQEMVGPIPTVIEAGFQPYFALQLGARKYFNSFTSWEFPAFNAPLNPLSRLEWPWDQTFFVARAGTTYSNLALIVECSGTLSTLSNPKAQDSDWTFPNNPNQKTIFSEGDAKPRCWIFDVSIAAPLNQASNIKGIAGYRASQFKFTYTDMNQESIDPNYGGGFVPGPSIEFVQYYHHWYVGGIVDGAVDLGDLSRGVRLPVLILRFQLDGAIVNGKNYDEHVLRIVPTSSEVRTRGFGWHMNLSAGFQRGVLRFDVEADLRRIETRGSIHDMEGTTNRSWDGARAWGEQMYLGVNGTALF